MNQARLLLGAAMIASLGLPFACSDGGNTGGAGTSSSTSGTAVSSSGKTTHAVTAATTGSGMTDCTGLGTPFGDPCGPCLEQHCCQELVDAMGDTMDAALGSCAQAGCDAECFPPAMPPFPLQCMGIPATAPSDGSCVTLGGMIACNPVTNAGCPNAGDACDISNGGFMCYATGNDHALCEGCGTNGDFCQAGMSCLAECARYCCTDADCGPGTCLKQANGMALFAQAPTLGVCGEGTGGAGGSGSTSSTASSTSSTTSSTASTGGSGGAGGAGGAGTTNVASAASTVAATVSSTAAGN